MGKDIAIQNHFDIYIKYRYTKTAEKVTVRRIFFFNCNRKLDLMLKRDGAVICENTPFLFC